MKENIGDSSLGIVFAIKTAAPWAGQRYQAPLSFNENDSSTGLSVNRSSDHEQHRF
jgi:hypothetical protein